MTHDPTRRRACLALSTAAWPAWPWGLAGCAQTNPAASPETFLSWSERFAEDWLRQLPEQSTRNRYFQPDEQRRLDGLLNPPAAQARSTRDTMARDGLAQLARHTDASLPPEQALSAEAMRFSLGQTLAGSPYLDHAFAFDQFRGLQVDYASLLAEAQPLQRAADVEPLMARLAAMPARIDSELDRAQAAAARGLRPPRFIAERALAQLQRLTHAPLAQEPVVESVAHRIGAVQGLSAEQQASALEAVRNQVERGIRPAWARVAAWITSELPGLSNEAGLSRLPDGEAAYVQALASATTTTLTPRQVHELGLEQVAVIEAELERLLVGMNLGSGSLNQRLAALNASLQPPATPDPRPALLERYAALIRDAERRAAQVFDLRPKAPVVVRRVGALTEHTAAASYTTPASDGSRPGVFWMPLPGPSFGMLGMRTLAIHEAVPGHHFQLAILQEMTTLPRWRRFRLFGGGPANHEGWALYAERLAIEQGWYQERIDGPGADVHGVIGAWNAQLFRARRLVVDTGLHAFGWSRQRAIDYGISASEVERYVVLPGQACAYMVGQLRLRAAREAARQRLGSRFSLPGFHNVVLRSGSVPLAVLDAALQQWQGAPA
jgi:uncharacterized protein (DUF885 family)